MAGLKVAKPSSSFLKSAMSCGGRSNRVSDHILEYYSNSFAFGGDLSRHGNLFQVYDNGVPKSKKCAHAKDRTLVHKVF